MLKLPGQNRFDSMNLNPDVAGRNPGDFRDRCGIHVFQVEQHHVAFERLEPMDQSKQPFDRHAFVRIPRHVGGTRGRLQLFQAQQLP